MTLNFEATRLSLSSSREHHDDFDQTYRPVEIFNLCRDILSQRARLPQLEYYSILEQQLLASMDLGRIEEAQAIYKVLRSKFSSGSRIEKLRGQLEESKGNYQAALDIYDAQLMLDPSNMHILKRRIMTFVAKGETNISIELLVIYLDTFMQDTEAWTTLVDLYCSQSMYRQALFCIEELMILRPKNHLYMLKYADLLFAIGDLSLSLKYYCGVLDIVNGCLHAWYGLKVTSESLLKEKNADMSNLDELNALSKEKIKEIYSNAK